MAISVPPFDFTTFDVTGGISALTVASGQVDADYAVPESYKFLSREWRNVGSTKKWAFDFAMEVKGTSDITAGFMAFGLSNAVDTVNALRTNHNQSINVQIRRNTTTTVQITLEEDYTTSAAAQNYSPPGNPVDVWFYCRLRFDPSVGTYGTAYLDIYSDVPHSTLMTTLAQPLHEAHTWTSILASSLYASGSNIHLRAAMKGLIPVVDGSAGQVIAYGSGATLLSTPRHTHLWDDGLHFVSLTYRADSAPRLQYWDTLTNALGLPHNVPVSSGTAGALSTTSLVAGAALTSCREMDLWRDFDGLASDNLMLATPKTFPATEVIAPNDLSINSTVAILGGAPVSHDTPWPTSEFAASTDDTNRGWVAGKTTTPDLRVYRCTLGSNTAGGNYALIKTLPLGAAQPGAVQIVEYENGDMGIVYSQDPNLFYQHWSKSSQTFSAAEAIITDLGKYDNFRAVTTRNNTLYVQYRKAAGDLAFKRRPAGGAFSAAVPVSAALAGVATDYYHTSCVNPGETEQVYCFYVTGTTLAYRIITAGVVGAEQTLSTSVSVRTSGLLAPAYSPTRMVVAYHDMSGMLVANWVTVSPTQTFSDTGRFISSFTKFVNEAPVVVTDGAVSLMLEWTAGGYGRGRLWNETTKTWIDSWTKMTIRYSDLHNTLMAGLEPSTGKLVFMQGARGNVVGAQTPLTVQRSGQRLSAYASVAALLADLTDISPSRADTVWGNINYNRGYKHIVIDVNGVIYYLFEGDYQKIKLAEYRGGVWSTPVTLVDTTNEPGQSAIYVQGFQLASDGTSIHLFWSLVGSETPGTYGNIQAREFSYVKVVPVGNGTYTLLRSDASPTTVPQGAAAKELVYTSYSYSLRQTNTAYTLGSVVSGGNGHVYRAKAVAGNSSSGAVVWPTAHFATVVDGGVTWEEIGLSGTDFIHTIGSAVLHPGTGAPAIVSGIRSHIAPYLATDLRYYYLSGGAWASSSIQNSAMPLYFGPEGLSSNGSVYALFKKVVNSAEELMLYRSTDGVTWTPSQLTHGSPLGVWYGHIRQRTAASFTVSWAYRVHRAYSESAFRALPQFPHTFWVKARQSGAVDSPLSAPVHIYAEP